ncbi:MAG: SAM-dependent methyltransferase [Fusobacteriaceae bacterium]|nr:SAM-dependent methyltransferase [Fusobacteriaceae bacterium]MBP6467494.1 SAM-dependent methyltransferase [Fusobacteriaceae bacterium]MBU9918428.1 SAM-dependent methyltransferase [Fusobacteriaceae bacterium]
MNYIDIIKELLVKNELIEIIISGKEEKTTEYNKISIKPFLKDEIIYFQFAYIYDKKTTHENIEAVETIDKLVEDFVNFKQMVIFSKSNDYQVLKNKKGVKVIKNKASKKQGELLHNRKKNYIIPEDEPCKFLEILGVMNEKGKVFKDKYDKFRQINKYLEFIRDIKDELNKKKKIRIVDFGSGKAYLTFALYYYINEVLGVEAEITGIDLKKDVVEFCNDTAKKLEYKNLKFLWGDIKTFTEFEGIDMIVTLHACDIATDMAIAHGIKWKSRIIMVVPCCQHEIFTQIKNESMSPLLKHGILKERISSLVTDAARGNLLEVVGYNVQFVEFIDMEHTPKNIMIRAIYNGQKNEKALVEYMRYKEFWSIEPYLEKSIKEYL